jgi:hypothetical protein
MLNKKPISLGGKGPFPGSDATEQPVGVPVQAAPTKTDDPALVIFGRDDSGKPHASAFTLDQRHEAIRAAALMSFQALAVEGADLMALAKGLPVGKVFGSGKGFVPFVKREIGEALEAIARDKPDQVIALPTVASEDGPDSGKDKQHTTSEITKPAPKDWSELTVGCRVLAVEDPDDGWWIAQVTHIHESGTKAHPAPMLTLAWVDFPEEPTFVRRISQVALLHPDFVPEAG